MLYNITGGWGLPLVKYSIQQTACGCKRIVANKRGMSNSRSQYPARIDNVVRKGIDLVIVQ